MTTDDGGVCPKAVLPVRLILSWVDLSGGKRRCVSLMMGKHILDIEYSNGRKVYAPGDVIEGAVAFELKKDKKIKKIKFVAIGESKVKLKTNDGKQIRNFEKYFEYPTDLYQGTDSEIPMGQHKYPFRFQLKPNLPTSYEGKLGYVRYTIQAVVEYPGILSSSLKCLSAFTVLDTFDLNALPTVRQPQRIFCEKKAGGICCCRKPAVTVNLTTEKSGFVPGEFIVVNGIIANGRSKAIRSLKVDLQQKVTFHGRLKNAATSTPCIQHTVTNSVASWNIGSKTIPGESTESWQHKQLMQIPPLIPTGLRHCSIMDVQYFLQVSFMVPGIITGSEVVGRCSLTIGSVPLMSPMEPVMQQPASMQSIASAPLPSELMERPNAPPPPYDPGNFVPGPVPLPTYEEAVTGGAVLRLGEPDQDGNQELISLDAQFTPQYTYFDFSQPAFNPSYTASN